MASVSYPQPHRVGLSEALPLLLAGVLGGVSLVAQPGKFAATAVPLPDLVAAGSAIFHISHTVQLLALLPMAWFVPAGKHSRAAASGLLATFAAALLLQHMWLLPPLDERLAAMRSGARLPASAHHFAYVVLEFSKMAALLALAWLRPAARPAVIPAHKSINLPPTSSR